MKYYNNLDSLFLELQNLKSEYTKFHENTLVSIQNSVIRTLRINESKQLGGISSGLVNANEQIAFFERKVRAASYTKTKREKELDSTLMSKLGYSYNFDKVLAEQFPIESDYLEVNANEDNSSPYSGKRFARSKSSLKYIPIFNHKDLLEVPFGPFQIGDVNDYDSKSLGLALAQHVYSGKIDDNLNDVHRQGDHTKHSGSIGLGGVLCKLLHDYVIFDEDTVTINLYTTAKSSLKKGGNISVESPALDFVNKKLQGYITLTAPNFEKLKFTLHK